MGVSRPGWMDDEQWGEYRMTEEYRHELTHVPDEPEPYDDYDIPYDYEVDDYHCDCGEIITLWDDVNECECGLLINAWGQRLKPEDEWEEY